MVLECWLLLWQTWPCCLGMTTEVRVRKAIVYSELKGLFHGSLEDKSVQRNVDDGGLPCALLEGRKDSIRVTYIFWIDYLWFLFSWGWRISCDQQETSIAEVKPLIYRDNWCCLSGGKNSVVINKRSASLRWNFLRSISSGSAYNTIVQACQIYISCWQLNLVMCKGLPGGLVLVACELKRPWKEANVLKQVVGLQFLKRGQGKILVRVQAQLQWKPLIVADAMAMRWPPGLTTVWCGIYISLLTKATRTVYGRVKELRWSKTFGSQKIVNESQALDTVGAGICFDCDFPCDLFFISQASHWLS